MPLTLVHFLAMAACIGALLWAIYQTTFALLRWLLGIRSRRRAKHVREGGCACCGYALFPVQKRCPECGTLVAAGDTAADPSAAIDRPAAQQ
jgi:hypothetical protein